MPLEAVMIVVDNSESSRNGDYAPTRYDAQADAVGIVFQQVIQGNPESSVGLMSMGGKGPEVLVTLTTDQGMILEGLHRTKKMIRGKSHLVSGIQVAGLALKHRQNKSQRQRIIVFVCSPIEESEAELVKLAKKMKKSAVSVDFVLFGDIEDENEKKLRAFNEAVKSGEGSHFEIITPGPQLLSDRLISTPILLGDNQPSASGGTDAGTGMGMDAPFDAADDPELALALRMSLEEENARQEKARRDEAAAAGKANLESVKEENESEPLLGKDGRPSGSGGDKKDDKKPDDSDKMDTS